MRVCAFIVVTFGLLVGGEAISASQPVPAQPAPVTPAPVTPETVTPETVTPIVELEQLAALGKSIAAIRYESDNAFFYAERADGLRQTARALEGGHIEFVAHVTRVSDLEVFIQIAPAGKTHLVLMHAALPTFGNLRTVEYPGIPSTRRLHKFSAPIGLRIGSEIELAVAKTLRRRDALVIRGTIKALPVWIESVFAPDATALISDWKVVDVNPSPSY